jgi:hypothetical protein
MVISTFKIVLVSRKAPNGARLDAFACGVPQGAHAREETIA